MILDLERNMKLSELLERLAELRAYYDGPSDDPEVFIDCGEYEDGTIDEVWINSKKDCTIRIRTSSF